jgi:acetylglutamate kinase
VVALLTSNGFVPVIACIGVSNTGQLFNVNADTFAGHLAARLGAARLVIAGTTPGVLDAGGATVASLTTTDVDSMIRSGTATAGMVAKLRSCEDALAAGVETVVIVDGRDADALERAAVGDTLVKGTALVREMQARTS